MQQPVEQRGDSDIVCVPLAPTSQPPTTGTPKAVVTLGPCHAPCEQSSVVVLLEQQSSKAREFKATIRDRDNTRRGHHQIVSAMITPIAASIAEIHAGFSAFPTCRKNAYQSIASTAPKLL